MANWWDKTKAAFSGAWGSAANPLTQKQKAEAYDPNRENFGLYGDVNGAQGQAQRGQDIAQSQGNQAAAYRQQGQAAQGQAADMRTQAGTYQGRGGVGIDASQAGRTGAVSGANSLSAFARQQEGRPSAAQAQLNNATAANMRGNVALSRSGRGAGSAQAGRAALAQNAITQGEAANNSAILRAQEDAAAQGRALGALQTSGQLQGDIYRTDTGRATAQGQLDLAARGQNDQMTLGLGQQALGYGNQALGYEGAADATTGRALQYEQLAQGYGQMDMAGRMGYEQLKGDQILGASQTNAGIEAQRDQGTTGMAIGAMGALAAMSDVTEKEGIKGVPEDKGILGGLLSDQREKKGASRSETLSALAPLFGSGAPLMQGAASRLGREDASNRAQGQASGAAADRASRAVSPAVATAQGSPAYEYSYKRPEKFGEGRYVGPMAQDVEKTPLGNTLVSEGPDGKKQLDGGRAGLVALSAAGEQQAQLDALQAEVERLRKDPYSTERWRAFERAR